MRTLDFVQIIYDDIQAEQCYPFARIHKNEKLTPYFENSVIADIVRAGVESECVGICSWRLAQKRGDMFRLKDKSLTHEKIINTDFDVAILTPRSPTHKPLAMASHWHGTAWDEAFAVFKTFLRNDLGVKVPDELKKAIYENHFIATREIYVDYVDKYLIPAIAFMRSRKDVFDLSAGYLRRKSDSEQRHILPILKGWGLSDYPIGVFVLERLFSIYCEGRGFKIVNL